MMKQAGPAFIAALLFLFSGTVFGQLNKEKPRELQDVGIEERLGENLPSGLRFATSEGDSVSIGELLEGDRPVLLNPVYYECPQLCTLVIEAVLKGVRDVNWNPGEEYRILTFSIDPGEDHQLAAEHKRRILDKLDKEGADDGWYFLTGKQPSIRALTEAIGFKYERLERGSEFAHGAAIMFASPEGKLTRYLYGIGFTGFNIRNALYEAADGNIGSSVEQALLYCYQYDPESQSYVPVAWRVMRLGGLVTLLFLGIFLGFLWLREKRDGGDRDEEEKLIIETKITEPHASD